ncbi:hypothetical protein BCR22_07180 [Enterococcus plantarum]|uniref:hypothetical protein n=1 Tax=Enterococcus plantarum TaxID=1077675 RepID=UPI00084DAFAC|nr:hypothetical protein [Enterococcus plantarum]OEG09369.1 hypothetical protein BCR22_07180 [Enterococcus plantarum]
MKHKLVNALLDTPFAILLAVVSWLSIWAGLLMIVVYVINKVFELPEIIWVNKRPRKNVN